MKDLKETLNEQLGQPVNEGLTIAGPNNEPGNVHTLAVGIPNNKGLYICYDTYTGIVEVINTPDIEKYVISKQNERYHSFKGISTNGIRDIKKLKQGQSVRTGEADSLIVTCLGEC